MSYIKSLVSKKRMEPLWQGRLVALGSAAIATGLTLATPSAAMAQAAYGSYLGVGMSFGVTSGASITLPNGERETLEDSRVSGTVAFRYKFLKVPISVRTQALLGNGAALVPTVSYDLPVNWRTDVYLGVGASFPFNGDRTTPVGNQAAFALQPGIDYVLPDSNLVLFGNAVIAFNAYRIGGGTAASLQGGVGVRF
ncbi:hypothetical protein [Leptothermofonsia sp. ETS-13]|uniref:hypothetical protein n=1 Tax=Leptothermofonsia sp. ETS-13 TaxID=3035696 RepID=UPI003BA3D475